MLTELERRHNILALLWRITVRRYSGKRRRDAMRKAMEETGLTAATLQPELISKREANEIRQLIAELET
ncbi:MAG: hypothetical protein IH599_00045 [Bacteroidales bacterium]|nr:hypothetical protein [Bacteroidales bacterium]